MLIIQQQAYIDLYTRKVRMEKANNIIESKDYLRTNDLTIEEIKTCKLFQHLSNKDLLDIISSIKQFTEITVAYYREQKDQNKIESG